MWQLKCSCLAALKGLTTIIDSNTIIMISHIGSCLLHVIVLGRAVHAQVSENIINLVYTGTRGYMSIRVVYENASGKEN